MRFTARCLCGPRVRPVNIAFDAHHAIATDAHQKGGRADPTGTMPLQRRWLKDLDARWTSLKKMLPHAINLSPVDHIRQASYTGKASPVEMFSSWLDEALKQIIIGSNGNWLLPYVRSATDAGALHARMAKPTNAADAFSPDQPRDEHGMWVASGVAGATMYRGGGDGNNPHGTYLTSDKKFASGYGNVTAHTISESAKVLDLEHPRAHEVWGKGWFKGTPTIGDRMGLFGGMGAHPDSGPAIHENIKAAGYDGVALAHGMQPGDTRVFLYPGHTKSAEVKDAAALVDRTHILQSLAVAELQGIADAVSQQVTRAYANGLMQGKSAHAIANEIRTVIEKVGVRRSHMLVSFMTVKAFTAATLDGLRSRGVTRVGIVPERLPRPSVTDAKDDLKGMVAVKTAEDKFVCDDCQEIADDGPYYIDEAEALIPAHPNCRCLLVPADDEEYADLTGLEPDDVEDSVTHTGAGVLVQADNTGRVLFIKRSAGGDHAGEWAFPGGAIEPGETAAMAARREATEEIGRDLGTLDTVHDRRDLGGVDFTTYRAVVPMEFTPTLNGEHTDWRWEDPTYPPSPLHPGVAATLAEKQVGWADDEASWNEEDHPRDKDGKFAFAAASADTSDKVHTVNQDLLKKGFAHGNEWSHYAPGEHGHSSLNEVHSFEVQKLAAGSFHNSLAKQGLAATEVKSLSGKDFTMYAVGEPKATAPHEAAPPAPQEHPLAQHLPSVQGKSTERVAMRKQMDSAKGDELKQLQAKHNASFWKEHQALTKAGKIEKADDIAKKLDNYSKKYGISNPLKQSSVSPATKAKAAAMVEKASTEFAAKVNGGKIDSKAEASALAKAIKANGSPSVEHHPAENKEAASEQQFHSYSVNTPGELTKMKELLSKGGYNIHETYSGGNADNSKFYGVKVPVGYKVEPAPAKAEAPNTNKTPKAAETPQHDLVGLKQSIAEHNAGKSPKQHLELLNPNQTPTGNHEMPVFHGTEHVETAKQLLAKHGVEATYEPPLPNHSTGTYIIKDPGTNVETPKTAPIEAPHHEPIDFNSLHKVGEQKGSNPGGVYEDKSKGETGDHPQYYVKSMDEAHSKNETLASKLYALAGSKTLDYVPVKPNGDTHYVATKFEKLDKGNVSQLDATERKAAQNEFATHAWLANWDSAGTGGDNQGVKNGVVKTLDVGGALEYRAKGTPKGELFGDKVTEFESMRTGSKNPDAVGLYGNMTKTQLQASTAKVNAIKNSDIVATVQSVYGPGAKSNELSQKLIARKEDLVAKAKALDTPPDTGIKEAPALASTKTKEQEQVAAVQGLGGSVPSKANTDKINAKYNLDLQPAHLGAIQSYIGGADWKKLNKILRNPKKQTLDVIKYSNVLDEALAKMPVHSGYMQRGIEDKSHEVFNSYAEAVGHVVTETQFTSGGKNHKLWGDLTMHIDAKNARDVSMLNPSEGGGEVILRKNTHLYIKKVNKKTHEVWAEEV